MARDAIVLPPHLMAKVELPPGGVAELVLRRAKPVPQQWCKFRYSREIPISSYAYTTILPCLARYVNTQ